MRPEYFLLAIDLSKSLRIFYKSIYKSIKYYNCFEEKMIVEFNNLCVINKNVITFITNSKITKNKQVFETLKK